MSALTTHILDTARGRPAAGVSVILEGRSGTDTWSELTRGTTDADGRIRDCHGDLRAESVCVTDGLCIFDCIEFNDRFRYGDVAAEVAFLAMDLDARATVQDR